jgi:GNAT superfamily N-acetyltransferase
MDYRFMMPGEEEAVIALVERVFMASVAPTYEESAVSAFERFSYVEHLRYGCDGMHSVLVAEEAGVIVGIIELRHWRHIALFFVDAAWQGKGVGRGLLSYAIEMCRANDPELKSLTINASVNSVWASEALGFRWADKERLENGIRYVPMVLEL